jgi:hypothetical protein
LARMPSIIGVKSSICFGDKSGAVERD